MRTGAARGHKRVCTVIHVEQHAVGTFEQDRLPGVHRIVQKLGRITDAGLEANLRSPQIANDAPGAQPTIVPVSGGKKRLPLGDDSAHATG